MNTQKGFSFGGFSTPGLQFQQQPVGGNPSKLAFQNLGTTVPATTVPVPQKPVEGNPGAPAFKTLGTTVPATTVPFRQQFQHQPCKPHCPVCQEAFRSPKVLPCGHSICLSPCLELLTKKKDQVRCPECRLQHPLPEGRGEGFPTNEFIIQMMDKGQGNTDKVEHRLCPLCENEDTLTKCSHCSLVICQVCLPKHSVEMKDELVSSLKELQKEVTGLDIDIIGKEVKEHFVAETDAYSAEILGAACSVKDAIDERVEDLKTKLGHHKQSEEDKIPDRLSSLKEKISEINDFCSSSISSITAEDFVPTQGILMTLRDNAKDLADEMKALKIGAANFARPGISLDTSYMIESVASFGDAVESREESNSSAGGESDCSSTSGVESLLNCDSLMLKRCIGRYGRQTGQFNGATCLAVCPVTGNIIVGDKGNGRIQVFSEDGVFLESIYTRDEKGGKTKFTDVRDVAVNSAGDIIVLESNCLHVIPPGESGDMFDLKFNQRNEHAVSFTIDNKGLIHICAGLKGIHVYDKHGSFVTKYSAQTDMTFNAQQIVVRKNGDIIVTDVRMDSRNQKNFVYTFNSGMQLLGYVELHLYSRLFQPSQTQFHAGKMTLVEDKYVLIAGIQSDRVHILDLGWRDLKTLGTTGYCRGQYHGPTGAAITNKGELVVISKNDMLQFF